MNFVDPLDLLTLAELDEGSRMIGADMVTAIAGRTERRWHALAVMAYLFTRRTTAATTVDTFMIKQPAQIIDALVALGVMPDEAATPPPAAPPATGDPATPEAPAPDPTAPARG